MDFRLKYLKYKKKYLQLRKTLSIIQNDLTGGTIKNVAIVIKKNDKILFVREKNKKSSLMLPGGQINSGERPWDAIKREWGEETGIKFPTQRQANIVDEPFNYHGHTLIFFGNSNEETSFYSFNKDRILKPGETVGIEWKTYDYVVRHTDEFKSYVISSLNEMHKVGFI